VRKLAPVHRDLVLVGGGHSHALVLRMLAMKPIDGLRITLVSPGSHTPYSGMLPGLIAGHYNFEQTHIDLERLCRWAGVRFVTAAVTALNPVSRSLAMADRPALGYDLVSIDIGSQPELSSVAGAREFAVPVKPVAGLWQRWQALSEVILERAQSSHYRVSVVGGGAGGVEIAMAMSNRLGGRVAIDLWCAATTLLEAYNPRARARVIAALARHNITVHLNARVSAVMHDSLELEDGSVAPYGDLFWCTGAAPAPWIAASGLPVDDRGFLAVRDTLQSTGDERVFGAGDIAAQINHPRPKAGVYAVRQAPVLAHNLRAVALGRPLKEHQPQQRFLSLISLGDRQAVADRGPFSAGGNWVWRWKDHIDTSFMARFSQLPKSMPQGHWGRLPELADDSDQEACGGCGAKVGADVLSEALAILTKQFPQHCLANGDDAVLLPAQERGPGAIVQSLDILREIVPDPWLMGRIAANHALSDLYACGARPVSALAAITLPFAAGRIALRDLTQILAGALHEFAAVGCVLNGGHTMHGAELGVGFAVNGVAPSGGDSSWSKRGAQPGDRLVLTRPLGTGVLFAAHMQLAVDGRHVHAAIDSMLEGNAVAAQLASSFDINACTDVTGFGLLGHLREMLGDTLGARLDVAALPVLAGAREALQAGYRSTMHSANQLSANAALNTDTSVDSALKELLYDPQTSGGLLIALPQATAQAFCNQLHEKGMINASVIGEVTTRLPGPPGSVSLSLA
jgi:selenide,water dikinase